MYFGLTDHFGIRAKRLDISPLFEWIPRDPTFSSFVTIHSQKP